MRRVLGAGALVAACSIVGGAAALVRRSPDLAPGGGGVTASAVQFAAALALLIVGPVMLGAHMTRTSGALAVLAGICLTAGSVPQPEVPTAWLFTSTLLLAPLGPPVLGAIGLTWRATRRRRRVAVAGLAAVALLVTFLRLTGYDPAGSGCRTCPDNLLLLRAAPSTHDLLQRFGLVIALVWEVGCVAANVLAFARWPRIARAADAPVLLGSAGACAVAAIAAAHSLSLPVVEIDPLGRQAWLVQCSLALMMAAGAAAGPLARRRMARSLALRITSAAMDRDRLRQTFAETIGDPDLELILTRRPQHGTPHREPGLIRVTRREATVAELRFSPSLEPMADRLATAVRIAGPALDLAGVQESLVVEEAELSRSRRRVVEHGDDARRRIERDLHDGAQQRLIALSLLAGQALDPHAAPSDAAVLGAAREQILLTLEEVRSIARGLFPAALTDHGLLAALHELQDHSPVPLRVAVNTGDDHLPAEVAMAAYRLVTDSVHQLKDKVTSEGVTVFVDRSSAEVHSRITWAEHDDQADGFQIDLGHARDRVHALSGSMSTTREGTMVTVEAMIPCAS